MTRAEIEHASRSREHQQRRWWKEQKRAEKLRETRKNARARDCAPTEADLGIFAFLREHGL